MHEYDTHTDRRTDHATVTFVTIDGIADDTCNIAGADDTAKAESSVDIFRRLVTIKKSSSFQAAPPKNRYE